MWDIFISFLGFVVFSFFVMSFLYVVHIRSMCKLSLAKDGQQQPPEDLQRWSQANNFEYEGCYKTRIGMSHMTIYAWKHDERPSFVCQYDIKENKKVKTNYDFVTIFADDVGLTTGADSSSQTLPKPPGEYMQSFSDMTFDDRLEMHVYSENFLINSGGAILLEREFSFEEEFVNAARRDARFVCKLWFWPLRWPYWHAVRKVKLHNLSIEDQHLEGMIKLPKDLMVGYKEMAV
ncbi:MAG: hypothetical protein K9M75_00405 [Phycisphaerae bacterium]|nr:hypothetical protein [Phycisphaerae bacterium]